MFAKVDFEGWNVNLGYFLVTFVAVVVVAFAFTLYKIMDRDNKSRKDNDSRETEEDKVKTNEYCGLTNKQTFEKLQANKKSQESFHPNFKELIDNGYTIECDRSVRINREEITGSRRWLESNRETKMEDAHKEVKSEAVQCSNMKKKVRIIRREKMSPINQKMESGAVDSCKGQVNEVDIKNNTNKKRERVLREVIITRRVSSDAKINRSAISTSKGDNTNIRYDKIIKKRHFVDTKDSLLGTKKINSRRKKLKHEDNIESYSEAVDIEINNIEIEVTIESNRGNECLTTTEGNISIVKDMEVEQKKRNVNRCEWDRLPDDDAKDMDDRLSEINMDAESGGVKRQLYKNIEEIQSKAHCNNQIEGIAEGGVTKENDIISKNSMTVDSKEVECEMDESGGEVDIKEVKDKKRDNFEEVKVWETMDKTIQNITDVGSQEKNEKRTKNLWSIGSLFPNEDIYRPEIRKQIDVLNAQILHKVKVELAECKRVSMEKEAERNIHEEHKVKETESKEERSKQEVHQLLVRKKGSTKERVGEVGKARDNLIVIGRELCDDRMDIDTTNVVGSEVEASGARSIQTQGQGGGGDITLESKYLPQAAAGGKNGGSRDIEVEASRAREIQTQGQGGGGDITLESNDLPQTAAKVHGREPYRGVPQSPVGGPITPGHSKMSVAFSQAIQANNGHMKVVVTPVESDEKRLQGGNYNDREVGKENEITDNMMDVTMSEEGDKYEDNIENTADQHKKSIDNKIAESKIKNVLFKNKSTDAPKAKAPNSVKDNQFNDMQAKDISTISAGGTVNSTKQNKNRYKRESSTSNKISIKTFNESQRIRNNVNMQYGAEIRNEGINNTNDENNIVIDEEQGEREYMPKVMEQHYDGNYVQGQDLKINILEIEFGSMFALPGLGKPLQSIPRTALPIVRETFIYVQRKVIQTMNDEHSTITEKLDALKKFAVLPTLLFTGIEYVADKVLSRSANILITCRFVRRDRYDVFNIDIFPGTKKGKTILFAAMSEAAIRKRENDDEYKKRGVDYWKRLGEISKAFRAAGPKAPFAPASEASLRSLKDLHPQRRHDLNNSEGIKERMTKFVYADDINDKFKKTICSRSKGISAGPDNMSIDVIKQLLLAKGGIDHMNRSKEYAISLSQTIQHIYEDINVPEEVKNFYRGAILHGIAKKPDAYNVILPRPITNGNAYTKGIDGAKMIDTLTELQPHFKGIQLGVCNPGGTCIFVHTSRVSRQINTDLTISKSDYKNAFNTQPRRAVQDGIKEFAKQSVGFVDSILRAETKLTYVGLEQGITYVDNTDGVQQGANLSGPIFCASVHKPLLELNATSKEYAPRGGNAKAYCDDMEAMSTNKGIAEGIKMLQHCGDEGQVPMLNMSKHLLLLGVAQSTDQLNEDIKRFQELGVPLSQIKVNPANGGDVDSYGSREMGIAVGSKEYVNKCIKEDILELGVKFNIVNETTKNDKHLAMVFLKSIMPGAGNHLFRNYTPTESIPIRMFYNEGVREALCNMMGHDKISELSLMIARLKMKKGGVGIQDPNRTVHGAYVASFTFALQFIIKDNPEVANMLEMSNVDNGEVPDAIREYLKSIKILNGFDSSITLESIMGLDDKGRKSLQKKLNKPIVESYDAKFMEALCASKDKVDIRNVATIVSGSGRDASAWITAIPTRDELTINSTIYANILARRLCADDPDIVGDEVCDCKIRQRNQQHTDRKFDHAANCIKEGVSTEKIIAHTVGVQQIGNFIQCATNSSVQIEPLKAFAGRDPVTDKRLDILAFHKGGKGGYDYTVTHQVPGAGLTMNQAKIPGSAADRAARAKIEKYNSICCRNGIGFFCPISYESGGTMNKEWEVEKYRLFAMMPGGNHIGYRNYWNSVFSIAVQTGVSNKILQWKYRKVQKENYASSGGYPVGDVELLTEIGSYQNNRMGYGCR